MIVKNLDELIDTPRDVRGSVWAKTVERAEVAAHRDRHNVISTKLYAGKSILHVMSASDPGDGFTARDPDLEDVYFATLQGAKQEHVVTQR